MLVRTHCINLAGTEPLVLAPILDPIQLLTVQPFRIVTTVILRSLLGTSKPLSNHPKVFLVLVFHEAKRENPDFYLTTGTYWRLLVPITAFMNALE